MTRKSKSNKNKRVHSFSINRRNSFPINLLNLCIIIASIVFFLTLGNMVYSFYDNEKRLYEDNCFYENLTNCDYGRFINYYNYDNDIYRSQSSDLAEFTSLYKYINAKTMAVAFEGSSDSAEVSKYNEIMEVESHKLTTLAKEPERIQSIIKVTKQK